MIKLNDTSATVNVLSDEQLTQVVGGRGHGGKHHKDYRYCHAGRRYDRDCYDGNDRGCYGSSDKYDSYDGDSYDYGCSYGGYDK